MKIDLTLSTNQISYFDDVLLSFLNSLQKTRIHKKKYINAFNCIISNLMYNYNIDPLKFTSISTSKKFFLKELNSKNIKYDTFILLFNWLKLNGFIHVYKGYINKTHSRHTRFICTDKLSIKFIQLNKNNIFFSQKINNNLIILKDEYKKTINFNDTNLSIKRKKLLELFNKTLSYSTISYNNKILPNPFIYRIFNNSSFKLGGRFYGGYFQQFSKKSRKNFFINGNETVELDYNCLHINLMYHLIKKSFSGDAYSIPTFPNEKYRNSIKLITIIMMNAKSKSSAIITIKNSINKGKIKPLNVEFAIEELLEKHSLISHLFFKGLGLELQYKESLICEKILKTFINRKTPLTILPIHDGFICEKIHYKKLLRTMKSSYKKITGFSTIKIKKI